VRDGTETRERIETTARRLFVEKGIAETSIRDIAKAARISQGAMYNHFASKEDLAWHLFSTSYSEFGNELARLAHAERGIEAKFRAMIGHVFRRFDEDPVYVTYVFFARHMHLRRITSRMGNPYMAFRTVISAAVRAGELPRWEPDLAASLVIGAVIQVIDTRILGTMDGPLARHTDRVAAACAGLLQG